MKLSRLFRALLALVLCLALLPVLSVGSLGATTTDAVASLGLYVIANENSMAKAALVGNNVEFEIDDFARAMNLSRVDSVTVTKIPPLTDGELRVGNRVIMGGERLRGSEISMLTYVASGANILRSSFDFRVNDSPVDVTCKVYLLEKVNGCPTLNGASEGYLNVSTHENVLLYGTLPCYDPDGDEVQIEIVSYPETGILTLTDRNKGEYTFKPDKNFSGKDEFKYVARDIYGNYSASRTVSLTVTKQKSSVAYADMENNRAYNAALTMTERGIMSGTQVGSELYFRPDETVTRAEFVVMAMNSLGMREVTSVGKTVFADDSDISPAMKDHIGVAYELGYIKGELDEKGRLCFYPNRTVTRAEAACIVASMINAATPTVTPTFSDSGDIPVWAAPSIYSLNYMGILPSEGGSISPLSPLTRADTATILCRLS